MTFPRLAVLRHISRREPIYMRVFSVWDVTNNSNIEQFALLLRWHSNINPEGFSMAKLLFFYCIFLFHGDMAILDIFRENCFIFHDGTRTWYHTSWRRSLILLCCSCGCWFLFLYSPRSMHAAWLFLWWTPKMCSLYFAHYFPTLATRTNWSDILLQVLVLLKNNNRIGQYFRKIFTIHPSISRYVFVRVHR